MTASYYRPIANSREFCGISSSNLVSINTGTDTTRRYESALLGSVLLNNSLWPQAAGLRQEDFCLNAHQRIFARMRELNAAGKPIDTVTLTGELEAHHELETIGGNSCLSDLIDGIPDRPNIEAYVSSIRDAATSRKVAHGAEALQQAALDAAASPEHLEAKIAALLEDVRQGQSREHAIHTLTDVPDLFSLNCPEVEYVVADLIPRGAVTMISGESGIGKSFMTLKMLVTICMGTEFLERHCEATPCLILDYENSLPLMRERLTTLAGGTVPGLFVWGGWASEPPPRVGSATLRGMAEKEKPLIVIDTMTRFHDADENSASEMRSVMAEFRYLANLGATVLLLHHCSKAQGSRYRGSSDILAAVDVAFQLEADPPLLTLHRFKSRFSPECTLHIDAEFAEGHFKLSESGGDSKKILQAQVLRDLIRVSPGLSGGRLSDLAASKGCAVSDGLTRGRIKELLREYRGRLWRAEEGPRRALLYFVKEDSGARVSGLGGSTLRSGNHPHHSTLTYASGGTGLSGLETTEPLEAGLL